MDKKDNIKNLFSSKLKDFEADVPMDLWSAIENKLEQTELNLPPLVVKRTNKKKYILALAISAIAASFLILTLFVRPESTIIEVAQEDEENNINLIENNLGKKKHDKELAEIEASQTESQKQKTNIRKSKKSLTAISKQIIPSEDVIAYSSVENTSQVLSLPSSSELSKENELDLSTNNNESEKQVEEVSEDVVVSDEEDTFDEPLVLKRNLGEKQNNVKVNSKKEKNKSGGWGVSLNGSLLAIGSDKNERGNTSMLFSHDDRSDVLFQLIDTPEENNVELKHSQPVSVGVLVSKDLSSKFSVETGLVYTHLSSKAKASNSLGLRETQKFDYLGVPLNLTYNFLKLGKARFYLTGGVMFQKDINGSYISHLSVDPKKNTEELITNYALDRITLLEQYATVVISEPEKMKRSIHQSNIQVSVHGLAGASFAFYKAFNVFGTLGVGHYFKAGNKYNTIFSDKKTQFDINFGVKFNF